MLVLWERDGLMVSELGERLSLDSGTLTPLLKRLEALGPGGAPCATRHDERRVRIALTASGRKLKPARPRVPGCILAASQCSLSEVPALTQQVQALRERLAALPSPSTHFSHRPASPKHQPQETHHDHSLDKVLYTAHAHTTGGRDGASRTDDGRLDVKLSPPGHGRRRHGHQPRAAVCRRLLGLLHGRAQARGRHEKGGRARRRVDRRRGGHGPHPGRVWHRRRG